MKRTQRTPGIRKTILGSHKVLSYVGFEPTALGAVKGDVETALTPNPTVQLIRAHFKEFTTE